MSLETVNKLSKDAESAINNLIRRDGIDWLELEVYEGKIGICDYDEDRHFTLKDGLNELLMFLDYDIEDAHYYLTDDELAAFTSLCNVLHVEI